MAILILIFYVLPLVICAIVFSMFLGWMDRRSWRYTTREVLIAMTMVGMVMGMMSALLWWDKLFG